MFTAVLLIALVLGAQQKQITIKDIYTGTFSAKGLDALRSTNSGTEYTVLNHNISTGATSVDMYEYRTSKKVATVLSSDDSIDLPQFSTYAFSKDASKLLLGTAVSSIYRHSTKGIYFVYDIASKKVMNIHTAKIQEPTLSPDGKKVAYVFENNLFAMDLETEITTQITTDGEKNKIINGVTDWVYEEEFTFVRAFEWNTDSSKIAFLRFDETDVSEFSMDIYGEGNYPEKQVFKYPKAGEENAKVSLHIYDSEEKLTLDISLDDAYYIPRLKWMQHKNTLSVQAINRHQNHLKLYKINAANGEATLLLEEKDKAYLDIQDALTFLADDSFIWLSERDGWYHLYLYNTEGKLIQQLTKGNWEVTSFYGYDQNEDKVYYQSTENGTINRGVYSVESSGKNRKELAVIRGTNSASFSKNYSYFINTYSSATAPPRYTLHNALTGKKIKDILDNTSLQNSLTTYSITPKKFDTIEVNGNTLNMYTIKPTGFDATKKYPLLMYQYSGPGSQNVANSWMTANDYWHQMLVAKGYIIACVDGRGTGFKGRDFKKITYLNLANLETQDQIAAAEKLSKLPYIDEERTGIWGWSYGGLIAANCLLKGNTTFEVAIAVAPVTSWRFYDTIYTERYMRTPQENPDGYDANAPLNYAALLKGKLLLLHGSGDDNVHVQNTMRFAEVLIQANKQFDWGIYPDKNHGIYGGNTRVHLFNKMTRFLESKL